jgi:radical SAM superfamily enzyme YgiQ (UPF0313 family)
LDLSFVGYNRLDLIARKPEQLKLLKDLNFIGHFFGIESLNYESAKSIGKGLKPQEIKDTLYKVRDTFGGKVSISAGFIAGLPHETRETLDTWVSWLKEENNPIDYVSLVPLGIIQTTHTSSSFFSNPEKYGYTLINGSWRNKEWSREEVSAIVKKYQDEFENLNRQKIFCFFLPRLLFYGFSIEQILNWTLRDIPKSVSLNMLEEKNNYSNKLLNLNR